MPEWQSAWRASTDFFIVVRMLKSAWLARKRNSSVSPMGTSPDRMVSSSARLATRALSASLCSGSGAAPSGAAAAASAEASVFGLSSSRRFARKDCVVFSTRSKATWKAMSRSSRVPPSSRLKMSTTAAASFKCARQRVRPIGSGDASWLYTVVHMASTFFRKGRELSAVVARVKVYESIALVDSSCSATPGATSHSRITRSMMSSRRDSRAMPITDW